jgi:hypothetical protein
MSLPLNSKESPACYTRFRMNRLFASRKASLLALAAAFGVSRLAYFVAGVRFAGGGLNYYLQFIDPVLFRNAFWQSLYYLREQPPLFNLFLGTIVRIWPKNPNPAFHAIYVAIGLATTVALFLLLEEMKVERRIAFTITLLFSISPGTVLYENWLFYGYPITMLFCAAALFLYRYAHRGCMIDGLLFFSTLATIGLLRVVYHLFWFWLVALAAWLLLRRLGRKTLAAAALPGFLLTAFYVKHLLLWGSLLPGSAVMQPVNLAEMATEFLPEGTLDSLIAKERISGALKKSLYANEVAKVAPKPLPTRVPLLDRPFKSLGAANWNSMWFADAAVVYKRDAGVVVREYPAAFARKVLDNLTEYCLPSDEVWPFDRDPSEAASTEFRNTQALDGVFRAYHWLIGAQRPDSENPWLLYAVLPALLLFGLIKVIDWAHRALRDRTAVADPQAITLLFCVANLFYLSAVVILFSHGDHNRYRDEMSAFYALLLGLALTRLFRRRQYLGSL